MVRLPWIEGSAVAILLAGLQQRWNGEDSAPFFFFFFFFFLRCYSIFMTRCFYHRILEYWDIFNWLTRYVACGWRLLHLRACDLLLYVLLSSFCTILYKVHLIRPN